MPIQVYVLKLVQIQLQRQRRADKFFLFFVIYCILSTGTQNTVNYLRIFSGGESNDLTMILQSNVMNSE